MPPTRRQAILLCALVVVAGLVCAALLTLAALTPVAPAALPVLVLTCVGCPMAAGCELPRAVRAVRRRRAAAVDRASLEALRRQLAELPETRHPLDL